MANKTNSSRIDSLENRMDSLESKIDRLISMMEEKPAPVKEKSDKSGTVKNSKNATQCTVSVVDGKGKGAGRKFIEVIFDGKPSEKVLFTLKGNDFRYFAPTKTWSAAHTEKRMKAVEALIK